MTLGPGISFVIPSYRHCARIQTLLRDLLPQLGPDDELIVCDDASGDGTVEALAGMDRLRLIVNPSNVGMVHNWNACLAAGTRAWICLIHSDDSVTPRTVATLRQACLALGEPGLVLHAPDRNADDAFRFRRRPAGPAAALQADFVISGAMVHRSVCAAVGTYDEHFQFSSDIEYIGRICRTFPSLVITSPRILDFVLHGKNHEFDTWKNPACLVQLEEIVRRLSSYADMPSPAAAHYVDRQMASYALYMLRTARALGRRDVVRQVGCNLRNKPYLGKRRRVIAYAAAAFGWWPTWLWPW